MVKPVGKMQNFYGHRLQVKYLIVYNYISRIMEIQSKLELIQAQDSQVMHPASFVINVLTNICNVP